MSTMSSVSGGSIHGYAPNFRNHPCFSSDYTQLTTLLDRDQHQTIVKDPDLFFSVYCKAWLERQATTGAFNPNWRVYMEKETINLYFHGNSYREIRLALEELRLFFLEALNSGGETEVCLVPHLHFLPPYPCRYFFCKRVNPDSFEKIPLCKEHALAISQASLVVDIRKDSFLYLNNDYATYIQPVLSKLAQSCGLSCTSSHGKQLAAYLSATQTPYYSSRYEDIITKCIEVEKIVITQENKGSAQASPNTFHLDALRV